MKLSLKLPARFAPRKPRAAVTIEATLLLPNDEAVPVSIKNISSEGFMGETEARIDADAWVGVALPDCGIVPVQVRWTDAGQIGAQFRKPLDLERLRKAFAAGGSEPTLFQARVLQGPL